MPNTAPVEATQPHPDVLAEVRNTARFNWSVFGKEPSGKPTEERYVVVRDHGRLVVLPAR